MIYSKTVPPIKPIIKSLKLLEKYEVDILGNYHKVKLPEKRLPFNIKK